MTGTTSTPEAKQSEVSDVLQERLIDAEYKIWKKNTPYLYDVVMTHALEWPSLTCQWLPVVKNAGPKAQEHSLLLGTHTTGEQNYLMVASCNLPKDDVVIDNREKDASSTTNNSTAAAGAAAPAETATSAPTKVSHFDDERKEVGGFGHASSVIGKIEIRMKIQHQGEVNRARYMPQNHFQVATRGPSPEIYIFDLSKHPSFPAPGSVPSPQVVCFGHTKEGFGMSWSHLKQGHLLTASDDQTVCLWDIQSAMTNTATTSTSNNNNNNNGTTTNSNNSSDTSTHIQALRTFCGHTDVVEDVDWHAKDPNLFISVGDDRTIRMWDIREANNATAMQVVTNAHDNDINCVSCNPRNEFIFATGSADKTIGIWDVRNLKQKTHTLAGHTDQVYMVEWSPFNESVLGSASADRRVGIWDLSRIGMEQSPEDAEDGPPELLFLHGGHTSKLSDFSWNSNDPWTLASVSEDNVLQVWQMAEEIYSGDGDDDDEDGQEDTGEGEDKLLGDDELE